MRRFVKIFVLIALFIFFGSIDVFASTNTFERTEENNYLVSGEDIVINDSMLSAILSTPAVDASEKVYDFANLYTDAQEKELYSLIMEYIDSYNLDFAIVTINNNSKESTAAYAQDFYDYNSFGIGNSYDGILFLIDMVNREFYMTTTGAGITMYTDDRIDKCLDEAFSYITEGEYYNATEAFIKKASWYASIGAPDRFGNEPKLKGIAKLKAMSWSSIFVFSVVATGIVIFIFISSNKSVRKANSSKYYLAKADVNVDKEIFLGRNVHSSPRFNDSSSGGSSGGGRSISSGSSGRSHGGGGRSF